MGWLFGDTEKGSAEDPVTGVDALKAMWNISTTPTARETPPKDVVTDIYRTAARDDRVPRRYRSTCSQ